MSTNYQLGKIYKIIELSTNECYIGSTCEPTLARRLAKHVANYKSYLNGKSGYLTSYKIIANGNYDIILLEKYPCNSKDELHARESHYSRTIECVNKIKNQGLFNSLGKAEYDKQYYDEHKVQKTQYYEKHKDRINEYSRKYIKQYYSKNKEKCKGQNKKNYEKNKKELLGKHNCQCGFSYTLQHKLRHERSNKHQHYEQNKLYYDIKQGLDMIAKLDMHFKN